MGYQSAINILISGGISLAILLATSTGTFAQSDFTVQGRIVADKTDQPLPFVTLSVGDGQMSSETNRDGYFRLTLPVQFSEDSLVITTVGYKLMELPLSAITPTNPVIRLIAYPVQSESVASNTYFSLAQPFQARDTLLKAIASIAKNYTQKPTLLRGFLPGNYREAGTNQLRFLHRRID